MNKNNLVVDREERAIRMSRVFDAPRELVWKVCTDPQLVPEWWGPRYLTTVVDQDGCHGGRRLALHPARCRGQRVWLQRRLQRDHSRPSA